MNSFLLHLLKLICFFTAVFISLNTTVTYSQSNKEWIVRENTIGAINDAAYSPDGNFIGVVSETGIYVIDSNSLDIIQFNLNMGGFRFLKWAPNNQRVFTANVTNEVGINNWGNLSKDNFIYDILQNKFISNIDSDIIWLFTSPSFTRNISANNSHPYYSSRPNIQPLLQNNNVAFSIDGSQVAFADHEFRIQIFNVEENKIMQNYLQPEALATTVTYTNDGNSIWTPLRKYDIKTGQRIEINSSVANSIDGVAVLISPDEKYLVTSNYTPDCAFDVTKGAVRLYDREDNYKLLKIIAESCGEVAPANIVHFTGEGLNYVFIEIGNYLSEKSHFNGSFELDHYTNFASPFSSNAEYYLSNGDAYPTPDLFRIDPLTNEKDRILPKTLIEDVIFFTPSEPNLLATHLNEASNKTTTLWDTEQKEVVSTIEGLPFEFIDQSHQNITISPDNSWIASSTFNGPTNSVTIHIFDASSLIETNQFEIQNRELFQSFTFTKDSKHLVVGRTSVSIWDIQSGEMVDLFDREFGRIFSIDTSLDSNDILLASEVPVIQIWNRNENMITDIATAQKPIRYVTYMKNDSKILYVQEDGITRVIGTDNGSILLEFNGMSFPNSFNYFDDQNIFIMNNQVWNVETGALINEFGLELEPIVDLTVSPNGKWIATRHENISIRVWETEKILLQNTAVREYVQY